MTMNKSVPTVMKFMTVMPHSIGSDQTIETAHKMMSENEIRHLPVMKGGQISGVISDRDLKLAMSIRGVESSKTTVDEIASSEVFLVNPESKLDDVSKKVFKPYKFMVKGKNTVNFEKILKDIGHYGDIIAKSRESLSSISRLVSYIKQNNKFCQDDEEKVSVEIMDSDVKALTDHAKFVASKINFLLEATLGMISIQQNSIIIYFGFDNATFNSKLLNMLNSWICF
jgi:CBS domain-containing protein